MQSKGFKKITQPFEATIILHPPNRRKVDIDNRIKALLDLLQKQELIENDNLCRFLDVRHGKIIAMGRACMTLKPMS